MTSILIMGFPRPKFFSRETRQMIEPFWRPYRRQILLAAATALVVGAAVAIQPLMIKWIIDSGILLELPSGELAPMESRLRSAIWFVGIFVFVSTARILIWRFGYRYLIEAVEGFVFQLRSNVFQRTQNQCLRFDEQISSGELFNYLMGAPIEKIKQFFKQASMSLPYQFVSLVVALIILLTFNVAMTAITLTVVVLCVLVNRRSHRVMCEHSKRYLGIEERASRFVSDILRGARSVKMHSIQAEMRRVFDAEALAVQREGVLLADRQNVEGMKPEGLRYTGEAIVFLAGAWFCIYRGMPIGTFAAFVTTFGMLMGPLQALLQMNLMLAGAAAALDRITTIQGYRSTTPEPEDSAAISVREAFQSINPQSTAALDFEEVAFAYDASRSIFDHFNCSIQVGERVALVGRSGSGKSTFVNLILRLYAIDQGNIRLFGCDLSRFKTTDLRQAFGVVPQAPYIFQGTLKDNLRILRPEATDDELNRAVNLAQMRDFIDRLPLGLETPLGQDGYNLSGGQRQRLALGRAILADPLIFVFDEATSALDNTTENLIQESLEKLTHGRTTIVIAHRLSTIRSVDRVLVFEDGKIIESGTHDDLMARKGAFWAFHQLGQDEIEPDVQTPVDGRFF